MGCISAVSCCVMHSFSCGGKSRGLWANVGGGEGGKGKGRVEIHIYLGVISDDS